MPTMRRHEAFAAALVLLAALAVAGCRQGGLDRALDTAGRMVGAEQRLSEDTVVRGLKEALRVGTGNAVRTVSEPGGYLRNPGIRIPLPEPLRGAEDTLRSVGLGPLVEDFETSMNRAAESAAPEAKAVFLDALSQMTLADARSILRGGDDAATEYFRNKTGQRLRDRFEPIVHDAMDRVGVTRRYQQIRSRVAQLPFVRLQKLELDRYVTGKALDGLFFMLAREEKRIRNDPAARTTELLRQVFGSRD
jgi:hypothetical protein